MLSYHNLYLDRCFSLVGGSLALKLFDANYYYNLVTADKQWQWRSTFTNVVHSLVISFWCPLALMQSSSESKQDNIVTRFSCSSYYIICSAWTSYSMDVVNLMTFRRKSAKIKTIVHHLVAIAWLSLGVFGKTHVCFISVGELLQIGIFFFHLRRLVALSGFQRNGLFYWSITKLRNVSFIGIRSAVFFWIQWQVFQHREDIQTTSFVLAETVFLVITAYSCIVGKMLINE